MQTGKTVLGALVALTIPAFALADEARDAARAEMESTFGIVPPFIELMPDGAEAGAWDVMKGSSGNPAGEIPAKYRELIALGVAAQIPCAYCSYAHTAFARAAGASEAEIDEAIGYAAEVRLWSTVLNGHMYDLDTFRSEIDGVIERGAAATH